MHRIWTAIRAFFIALVDRELAEKLDQVLEQRALAAPEATPSPQEVSPPPAKAAAVPVATRSDALALLATLQREARFVDFLKEPLSGYSDAQVGAAVRDVHRDCAAVVERLFSVRPLVNQDEGSAIELASGFDPGRYRLVGSVSGEPPFRGRLTHHGWEATSCQLPAWTGTAEAMRVVAPAEVELG